MFGNPETTTGGNALKFYASVRLDIRRIGAIKQRRGSRRQRNARQGRQEQGRAAVPRGAVRHPLRRGHFARRRDRRARRHSPHRREVRRVVRLQRRQDRAGQGQRARVPARASGHRGRDRSQDPRGGGCSDAGPDQAGSERRRRVASRARVRARRTPQAEMDDRGRTSRSASLKATAVRMLARREYGRAELAAKLTPRARRAMTPTACSTSSTRLGYLSDARFANAVVAQKSGQYGKRAIVHALKEGRVEPSAAQDALRALEGVDELAGARRCGSAASACRRATSAKRRGRCASCSRAATGCRWRSRCCAPPARRRRTTPATPIPARAPAKPAPGASTAGRADQCSSYHSRSCLSS